MMLERSEMEEHIRDTMKMLSTIGLQHTSKISSARYYAQILADEHMNNNTKLLFIKKHFIQKDKLQALVRKAIIQFKKSSTEELLTVAYAKVMLDFVMQFDVHLENAGLERLVKAQYAEALSHFTIEGLTQVVALKADAQTLSAPVGKKPPLVSKKPAPVQDAIGSIVTVTATPVAKTVVVPKPTPVVRPTPPKPVAKSRSGIITPLPNTNNALEAVSANREFRTLVATIDIEIAKFDEMMLLATCTKNGVIDYKNMCNIIRHNYSNYDKLRLSRKLRRNNTYWKITVHPALRIALCEQMILAVKDPYLHACLINEIERAYVTIQKDIKAAAAAPYFMEAIDAIYAKTVGEKLQNKSHGRLAFVLGLQTI